MEFAVISPTAGLERYATLSRTHLVLAHIWDRDKAYRNFYLKRKEADDFIILDNGGYEGEPYFNWQIIRDLEPSVVVLPDYYLQPWKKTWHAAIHHLDINDHEDLGFEWLYIPQAVPGDLHGFIQSYQEAAEDSRVGWLGIPRCLATDITSNPLARVEVARLVRANHPHLKLHAFGMVNGDVHELPYLAAAGVNSIDSSAPVWRGWCGCSIDKPSDRKIWDEQGIPVLFDDKVHPSQRLWLGGDIYVDDLIKSNLEACGVSTKP